MEAGFGWSRKESIEERPFISSFIKAPRTLVQAKRQALLQHCAERFGLQFALSSLFLKALTHFRIKLVGQGLRQRSAFF